MKKLLRLIILMPVLCFAQKKNNNGFAYITPGFYAGKNSSSNFFAGAGVGYRQQQVSLGASFYYNIKYRASLNGDLRLFLSKNDKPGPFIFIQPGISFYRDNTALITTKGGFDFKGGVGIMDIKKPGLMLR